MELSMEDIAMGKRPKKLEEVSATTKKELKLIKELKDLVESKSVKSVKKLKGIDRKMLRKAYSTLRDTLMTGSDVIRGASDNIHMESC